MNLSSYFSSNSLKDTSQLSKWKHPAEKNIFFCILFQCKKIKTCRLDFVSTVFYLYGSAAGPTPVISSMAVSQ